MACVLPCATLETRGAGFMGAEQHGNLPALALTSFTQMLGEAVAAPAASPLSWSSAEVTINLPADFYLMRTICQRLIDAFCIVAKLAAATELDVDAPARYREYFGALPLAGKNCLIAPRSIRAQRLGANVSESDKWTPRWVSGCRNSSRTSP